MSVIEPPDVCAAPSPPDAVFGGVPIALYGGSGVDEPVCYGDVAIVASSSGTSDACRCAPDPTASLACDTAGYYATCVCGLPAGYTVCPAE